VIWRTRLFWGLLILGLPLTLNAQGVYYEGGLSLASGTYIFTERTNTVTLLTGLAFQAGPVTLRGTLPAYAQNTTLVAASSAGLVPTGGSSSQAVADSASSRRGRGGSLHVTRPDFSIVSATDESEAPVEVPPSSVTGFGAAVGDPTVGLTAGITPGSGFSLLFGLGAKVPVNDTASFGTGAWDVGASASLSLSLGLTTMVGVSAAYWCIGDAPGLELRDATMLSATVSHLALSGWGLSASAFSASPVIEGFASSVSVSAGVLRMGSRGRSIGLNVSLGLSETAPDVMVGVTWRFGLVTAR